jgi:hypothetical protein
VRLVLAAPDPSRACRFHAIGRSGFHHVVACEASERITSGHKRLAEWHDAVVKAVIALVVAVVILGTVWAMNRTPPSTPSVVATPSPVASRVPQSVMIDQGGTHAYPQLAPGDTVTCAAGGGGGYVPRPGNAVGGSGGFTASTDANGLVHVTCPHHGDSIGNV